VRYERRYGSGRGWWWFEMKDEDERSGKDGVKKSKVAMGLSVFDDEGVDGFTYIRSCLNLRFRSPER
jgi:hypothetical protein